MSLGALPEDPAPAFFEQRVDGRHEHERDERRRQQAADDDARERRLELAAVAESHGWSLDGIDVVEISSGFITVPADDLIRLVERVRKLGMKAKAEVGIQFGAGGASAAAELSELHTRNFM